jgi:hypothetical protein
MDLDPNARDESQHRQEPGEAVALNYIDKVHTSLTKQWDAMARSKRRAEAALDPGPVRVANCGRLFYYCWGASPSCCSRLRLS